MSGIIYVAIGGFFGAICRFYISKKWNGAGNSKLPTGTLLVNLIGAFLLGVSVGFKTSGHLYALVGIGFMGAFTTFSTLQLEVVNLEKEGKRKLSYRYLLISYAFGLILAFLGMIIGESR